MKSLTSYQISDIHAMSEATAAAHALDKITIKGYEVYFVDFGGHFGYSALVFGNGHHIYHADDFQLHHSRKTPEELRQYYAESIAGKLFTVEELKTITDYNDYRAKQYFVMNYYGMREDRISDWFSGPDEERKRLLKKTETMFHSSIAFAWYESADFVRELDELWDSLQQARRSRENDYQYIKEQFLYEMYNHEYAINWQGDFDVVSCFANVNGVRDYYNIEKLFDAAGFTDLQRQAYMEARRDYLKKQSEED